MMKKNSFFHTFVLLVFAVLLSGCGIIDLKEPEVQEADTKFQPSRR